MTARAPKETAAARRTASAAADIRTRVPNDEVDLLCQTPGLPDAAVVGFLFEFGTGRLPKSSRACGWRALQLARLYALSRLILKAGKHPDAPRHRAQLTFLLGMSVSAMKAVRANPAPNPDGLGALIERETEVELASAVVDFASVLF